MFYSYFRSLSGYIFQIALGYVFVSLLVGAMTRISLAQGGAAPTSPAAGVAAESNGYLEDTPDEKLKNGAKDLKSIIPKGKFDTPVEKQLLDDFYMNY
jgi:hypothetical protein